MLFQSPLEGRPGPAELSAMHMEFLEKLAAIRRVDKPGLRVVEEVAAALERGDLALRLAMAALGHGDPGRGPPGSGRAVTSLCGFWHGDFAPWNTRVRDGRLSVFDWESCEDGCHWDGIRSISACR